MENLPKNLEKELGVRTQPKPSKKTRKWNLLIVGDHGKIIPVTRFKGLMVTSAIVLVAAVITAVFFYFIYMKSVKENKNLAVALDVSRQSLSAVRDEKDILMTRLVLAESRIKEIQEKQAPKTTPATPPAKSGPDAAIQVVPVSEKIASPPEPVQEQKPEPDTQTTPSAGKHPDGVAVEAFLVFHETDTNKLKVEFQIKNMTPGSEIVSGYAFVILKRNAADRTEGLVFPSVKMISGKPSLINTGQYFSISRFKSMKFEKDNMANFSGLKSATVFIYATSGELLMDKTFPISVEERASVPEA